MPMRGVCTTGPDGAADGSSTRPAPIGSPSSAGPTASAWPSRPGPRQRSSSVLAPAPLAHLLEARRRLERADQDGLPVAFLRAADDVEHPVHAVAEVHVDPAGRPEHDSRCAASARETSATPGRRAGRPRTRRCALRRRRSSSSQPIRSCATSRLRRAHQRAMSVTPGRPARASARGGCPAIWALLQTTRP